MFLDPIQHVLCERKLLLNGEENEAGKNKFSLLLTKFSSDVRNRDISGGDYNHLGQ